MTRPLDPTALSTAAKAIECITHKPKYWAEKTVNAYLSNCPNTEAVTELVEGLKEAEKLISFSIKSQDEYTVQQEKETGISLDVYLMPQERAFVSKARELIKKWGG